MRGKIILFFVALCLAFDFAFWTWIHMIVWEHGQGELHMYAVAVEQDSVCDGLYIRQLKSLNKEYEVRRRSHGGMVSIRGPYMGYRSKSADIVEIGDDDDATKNINMLFLADRGSQSAIIGYRYFDTNDGQNHICTTWESNEWWTRPEPCFVECFCSIECMFNLL